MKKNDSGFTLIETIIAFALIVVTVTVLGNALFQTTKIFLDANAYKDATDSLYDSIQSDTEYKNTSYRLVVKTKKRITKTEADGNKSTSIETKTQPDIPIRSKKIAMKANNTEGDTLELNAFDTSLGYNFIYGYEYKIFTWNENHNQHQINVDWTAIPDFNGWGVTNYKKLPRLNTYDDSNSAELKKINSDFGKWAFAGWSTRVVKHISPKKGYQFTYGDITPASEANNWQGLLTSNNFDDYLAYVKKTQPNKNGQATIKLYATYVFTKDVYDSSDDVDLKNEFDAHVLENIDRNTLQGLADTAANLIRMNGITYVKDAFGGSDTKECQGLFNSSNGIEILHFRENGWPVIAEPSYKPGDKPGESDIENNKIYKNIPKIGNEKSEITGGVKSGFLHEVFDGVGFDLSKVGTKKYWDWLGINYNYAALFLNKDLDDTHDKSHKYSLFMRINENTHTVYFWIGEINKDGTTSTQTEAYKNYIASQTYL